MAEEPPKTVTRPSHLAPEPPPEPPKVTPESRQEAAHAITGQVLAVATMAAAQAGLPLSTWLERAVRAYAAAPMTHAERQRAYRNRQAAKAGR